MVRDALRVTAAPACLLVQTAVLFVLTGGWVEKANASTGECGYDGTGSCLDAGLEGVAATVWLVAIVVELAVGTAWWVRPLWRQRLVPGVDEWWALITVSLPRALMAGCLLSVLGLIGWWLLA